MPPDQRILEFYATPSAMTSPGRYASDFRTLPTDINELVSTIQQLVIYDAVAADFYGFDIPHRRLDELHIRPVEQIVGQLQTLDGGEVWHARAPDRRLVGRCRNFMLLLLAALRAHGTPARARCGFGAYFNPPYFEDHWVCEYWNHAQQRWIMVDTQFDEVWRRELNIKHDIMDVPRDQFLVAGDAWQRCRNGNADAAKFGIEFTGMRGLWFIAGSLIRDVAALNKVEMLPWDVWGAQPKPDEEIPADQLPFFDQLAALSLDPDAAFDELRRVYQEDERVRVPDRVFNALTNRMEAVSHS